MSTTQLPPNYIQRENAESVVGKSPKTIYRRIKQAIEAPGKQTAGLLDHCCVQLLDGEVIEGTCVESMAQVDSYRQQGRVPVWYIAPEFFREYFQKPDQRTTPKPKSKPPVAGTRPADRGERGATSFDQSLIEQYEIRLREKDEQIEELRADKLALRNQLSANTNLTERITGLLSHSQLAALGVPADWQTAPTKQPEKTDIETREIVVVSPPTEPSKAPSAEDRQPSSAAKTQRRKRSQSKPARKTTTRRRKTTKPKPTVNLKPAKPKAVKKRGVLGWLNQPIVFGRKGSTVSTASRAR